MPARLAQQEDENSGRGGAEAEPASAGIHHPVR